ncbi:MAG: phage tail spike protein [Anaerotignaceae bacterium]
MSYPIIVNKNALTVPLAYLNNIEEGTCKIKETINGEYTLNFTAIVEEFKTEFLYDENNLIEVDGDLFKPLILEELHSEDGLLTISVSCEHITYELLENVMADFSYSYKDITTVIIACLMGTDFTFTGTDVTLKTDINYTEECNSKQILQAIANNWKAELKYNRYNIYAYNRIGADRGVDFRFGKNVTGLKRTVDRSTKDSEGNPTISYEVDVVELKFIDEDYAQLEYFELGDTVRIVDSALNISVKQRIVSLERDVLTGKNTSLTLGNVTDDIRTTISSMQSDVTEVKQVVTNSSPDWNKIKEITDNLGNVIASKLAGTLQLATTAIENATTTMKISDNGILFHNQPTEELSTFACLLNSNGIMFANSKDVSGNWEWQSALNSEGLIANKVVASALYGLTMEAVSIVGGTITGGVVNGVTIEGSTIYAGNRTAGNYTEISGSGNIRVYQNNNISASFWTNEDMGGYVTIHNSTGYEIFRIQGIGSANEVDIQSAEGNWSMGVGKNLRILGNIILNGDLTVYGTFTNPT